MAGAQPAGPLADLRRVPVGVRRLHRTPGHASRQHDHLHPAVRLRRPADPRGRPPGPAGLDRSPVLGHGLRARRGRAGRSVAVQSGLSRTRGLGRDVHRHADSSAGSERGQPDRFRRWSRDAEHLRTDCRGRGLATRPILATVVAATGSGDHCARVRHRIAVRAVLALADRELARSPRAADRHRSGGRGAARGCCRAGPPTAPRAGEGRSRFAADRDRCAGSRHRVRVAAADLDRRRALRSRTGDQRRPAEPRLPEAGVELHSHRCCRRCSPAGHGSVGLHLRPAHRRGDGTGEVRTQRGHGAGRPRSPGDRVGAPAGRPSCDLSGGRQLTDDPGDRRTAGLPGIREHYREEWI